MTVLLFNAEGPTSDLIDLICQAIFAFDILFNMITSFEKEDHTIERNLKVVVFDYVKSWFLVDLVAFIPFQYFTSENSSAVSRLIKLIKLQRLVRLAKLGPIIKSLNKVTDIYVRYSKSTRAT